MAQWVNVVRNRSGRTKSCPLHGLTLMSAWLSNHTPSQVWDEIVYPFSCRYSVHSITVISHGCHGISNHWQLDCLTCSVNKKRKHRCHGDIIKWKHFLHYWRFVQWIHWSPVNSPNKDQWRGALIFSLICAWINDRINNRETDDLKPRHAHYDVIVMFALLVKALHHEYSKKKKQIKGVYFRVMRS